VSTPYHEICSLITTEQLAKVLCPKHQRIFYPDAGVTPQGTFVAEAPEVKIYLQHHPNNKNRNVAVVYLSSHLSREFMD